MTDAPIPCGHAHGAGVLSDVPTPAATHKREREVLDAATELFWEQGYGPTSVAAVADRLGMLKGSLYYYVDSKEDLLMRVIQEAHDEAVVILDDIGRLEAGALERLRAFVERYVLWSLENLERVGLYFREWHNLTGDRRRAVRDQRKAFESFVESLIVGAQDEGDAPREQDAHTVMMYVLCAINSVWAWYRRGGPLTPEETASRYGAMAVATVTGTRHP